MGDIDDADLIVGLQLAEHIDNRHPQGSVQHGDRLIGDNQRWFGNQGAGDGDSLGLAAGEFVGIAAGDFGQRQADFAQNGIDVSAGVFFAFFARGYFIIADGLIKIAVNSLERAEGGEGVLEHRLDFFIEPGLHLALADVVDDSIFIAQGAFGRGFHAQHHFGEGSLAAAAFTHNGKDLGFVGINRNRGAVDRVKFLTAKALPNVKDFAQVFDLQQGRLAFRRLAHGSIPLRQRGRRCDVRAQFQSDWGRWCGRCRGPADSVHGNGIQTAAGPRPAGGREC